MSDMVERVAEALHAVGVADVPLARRNADVQKYFRDLSRAAIAAMRTPTGAMLEAGIVYPDNSSVGRGWQAMIDAALSSSVPATSGPPGLDMPDMG